jgi:hypothetical protein
LFVKNGTGKPAFCLATTTWKFLFVFRCCVKQINLPTLRSSMENADPVASLNNDNEKLESHKKRKFDLKFIYGLVCLLGVVILWVGSSTVIQVLSEMY